MTAPRIPVFLFLVVFPLCQSLTPVRGMELLKLTADDSEPGDYLGGATPAFTDRTVQGVALQGNRALVGAPGADTDIGNESGAAYVFDTASGQQLLKLTPDLAAPNQTFGSAVGFSGNTAIIGAANNVESIATAGSAYLFDLVTGQQLHTLLPEVAIEKFDGFGWSAAIDGERAIVGAPFYPSSGQSSGGSAFVFDVATGQQLLQFSSDRVPLEENWFGAAVDISGQRAIVGSWTDNKRGELAGAAFVFDVATGQQLYKLTANDAQPFDQFGHAVAIQGNLAIVGSPVADDDTGEFSGAAYLFDITTGQQLRKLRSSESETNDNFGWSVDLQPSRAIVGAKGVPGDTGFFSGAAYVFDVATGEELLRIRPRDIAAGDQFGWAVSLDGDRALIAAPFDDDACQNNNACDSGSAYLFDVTVPRRLEAGDANQDLVFDQRDIVSVSQAGKYLTGQPATWGEGDWDGAPGGTVGNPPSGNARFDQRDIVAALAAGKYLTGPYAANNNGNVLTSDVLTGDEAVLGYDAATGELWLQMPEATRLTSIDIESASGIFSGKPADNLGGTFDIDSDQNLFKATFGGSFGAFSFGAVAQPGLSEQFLRQDLAVIRTLQGGGLLSSFELVYVAVPEPAALAILISGLLGVFVVRRST